MSVYTTYNQSNNESYFVITFQKIIHYTEDKTIFTFVKVLIRMTWQFPETITTNWLRT